MAFKKKIIQINLVNKAQSGPIGNWAVCLVILVNVNFLHRYTVKVESDRTDLRPDHEVMMFGIKNIAFLF